MHCEDCGLIKTKGQDDCSECGLKFPVKKSEKKPTKKKVAKKK